MAAIQATSSAAWGAASAYQREAARLAASTPKVGGTVISREARVSLGPFSVRYTATDYAFDLTGATAQTSFADALDAAATTARLADAPGDAPGTAASENAVSRRLALAGYTAAANTQPVGAAMFRAVA
jgi:hypothetical protein